MDPLDSLRSVVEELPPEALPAAIGALAEAQALATLRLHANGTTPEPTPEKPKTDRLLTTAEAADMLGVETRWIYRRSDKLPFTRRLGARTLRFSEAGLRRWLDTRPKGAR